MNSIPLHVLKNDLAEITGRAARGEIIQITKHNQPFVTLSPAQGTSIFTGAFFGKRDLKPGPELHHKVGKVALRFLTQDRDEE